MPDHLQASGPGAARASGARAAGNRPPGERGRSSTWAWPRCCCWWSLGLASSWATAGRVDGSALSPRRLLQALRPGSGVSPVEVTPGTYETRSGRSLLYVRGRVLNRGAPLGAGPGAGRGLGRSAGGEVRRDAGRGHRHARRSCGAPRPRPTSRRCARGCSRRPRRWPTASRRTSSFCSTRPRATSRACGSGSPPASSAEAAAVRPPPGSALAGVAVLRSRSRWRPERRAPASRRRSPDPGTPS